MPKQVLQLSEEDFDYMKFEIKITPSRKKRCNYKNMEEIQFDDKGNILNPFKPIRNKAKRFICFEALRRDVSLEQLIKELRLSSDRERDLLKSTYDQVKRCYFS